MTETSKIDPLSKGKERPERPEEKQFRVEDGSLLLWKPAKHGNRDVPAVVCTHFRNGCPAIRFAKFNIKEPFVLSTSRDGIALSLLELDQVMERVRRLTGVLAACSDGGSDVAA